MDAPTTARGALNFLRRVREAVDASPVPIPDEWEPLLGQRRPSMARRPVRSSVAEAGKGAGVVRTRPRLYSDPPWDSTRNGLSPAQIAAWPAAPILLTTDDAEALGRWSVAAYAVAPTDNVGDAFAPFSRVFERVSAVGGRPRVVVWGGGRRTPASPRGTHLLATAAHVARQSVEAVTAWDTGRRMRSEAAAYRHFADAAEAAIPATTAWVSDPFVTDLLDAFEQAPTGTPAPPAPVAATAYGTAFAGPSDRPRNGRGRP